MLAVHSQYITDNIGNKLSVILPTKEFKEFIEDLKELEDIPLTMKPKHLISLLFL